MFFSERRPETDTIIDERYDGFDGQHFGANAANQPLSWDNDIFMHF